MATSGSVPAGTRVGRYEIVSLLRQGGMGEVYTARDGNLGRDVALKILPKNRTSDPARVARFVREARASSTLNHPSIVAVHDAGAEDGVHFLAMELIDGKPLSEWMRQRHSVAARVEVMAQVADGLAQAHGAGIVHRDLKPDNIMVTKDGRAKIVDFGVAKLTERLGERTALTGITTPTSRVGTTAYMSPEQVEGKPLDHRTDVFSFGIVCYELLTGANPFAAPQYADTLHNIAHLAPPLGPLPHALRRVVQRCLRKEPELRYDSLRDAALDLRDAMLANDPPERRVRRWWAMAALSFVAVGAIATWLVLTRRAESARAANSGMTMSRLTHSGRVTTAAISPDGKYLVHAVREGEGEALYVKQIATGTLTRIAEPAPRNHFNLQVSHDSSYAFYAAAARREPNVAHVYQLPLLGGTPRLVAADTEFWFSLSPDGTRVVFRRYDAVDRVHRITVAAVDGTEEKVVLARTMPEFIEAPRWMPDGQSITFFAGNLLKRNDGSLHRMMLPDGEPQPIPAPKFPGVGTYAWLPDGAGMLFTAHERKQQPQVWLVPSGKSTGRKVTSDVSAYFGVIPTADGQSFSAVREETDSNIYTLELGKPAEELRPVTSGVGHLVGGSGVHWLNDDELLFSTIGEIGNAFVITDAHGRAARPLIQNQRIWDLAVSHDGRRIAYVSDKSGSGQIWVADSSGANPRQITNRGSASAPSFTPDGASLVFVRTDAAQQAWRVSLDGGEPVAITHAPTSRPTVSPDGKWLLCRMRAKTPGQPLWRTALVPIGGGAPRFFHAPRFGGPPLLQWHPNGRAFVFTDYKNDVPNIWMQDVSGGEPEQLTFFTSGEIFAFELARDGRRVAMSRGESKRDAVLIRDFR